MKFFLKEKSFSQVSFFENVSVSIWLVRLHMRLITIKEMKIKAAEAKALGFLVLHL